MAKKTTTNKKGLLFGALMTTLAMTACSSGEKAADTSASGEPTGECWGANSCKGKGDCGGKGHSCAGMNACKGKGWVKTTEAECKAKKGKFKS